MRLTAIDEIGWVIPILGLLASCSTPAGPPAVTKSDPLNLPAQRKIAGDVSNCWPGSSEAYPFIWPLDLIAKTDRSGTIREVSVSAKDDRFMRNAGYAAGAHQAMAVVLNPKCVKLPLPASLMGNPDSAPFPVPMRFL